MKKTKRISVLVLICSLFSIMILNYINTYQFANTSVVHSNKYNDGNEQNALNYYVEEPCFPNIQIDFNESAIASGQTVNPAATPVTYQNLEYFSGKTITKIGIPVKTVQAIDENQIFTLYVVDKTPLKSNKIPTVNKTYELKLPVDQLGTSTTVNKWVYVDLSKLNVSLSENETLAFGASTDTVNWGYIKSTGGVDTKYSFKIRLLSTPSDVKTSENIFFDIYAQKEESVSFSNELLKDLNFSILGDSISTYAGYSNDSINTNSTIGSNSVFYKGSNGITNVNDTWWMQAINHTGMNLLVNNSYSGDTVAKSHSTRSLQLHDDTGTNADTNPDVIAVYFGINDIKNGVTVATFKSNYTTMINNIRNKYKDAKIFIFTHVPYKYTGASVPNPSAAVLEEFNDVIREITKATDECYLVDLYANSGITHDNYNYYMYDVGLHPNSIGMDAITKTFLNVLDSVYVKDSSSIDDSNQDESNTNTEEEDKEELENPYTSTGLIEIISLILIVGSIIVLINTLKNTKINKYE